MSCVDADVLGQALADHPKWPGPMPGMGMRRRYDTGVVSFRSGGEPGSFYAWPDLEDPCTVGWLLSLLDSAECAWSIYDDGSMVLTGHGPLFCDSYGELLARALLAVWGRPCSS